MTWAKAPREPLCICDALGMCPTACEQCPACGGEVEVHCTCNDPWDHQLCDDPHWHFTCGCKTS